MTGYLIPNVGAALVDGRGAPTREWYNFFRTLLGTQSAADAAAQISGLSERIATLEEGQALEFAIKGRGSVKILGTLQNGLVQILLDGDLDNPAASYYYGTDATGAKGWHALNAAAIVYDPTTSGLSATDVQAAVDELQSAKAPINSPTLTGDPKAPTPSPGDNDTSIATTAFVAAAIAAAGGGGGGSTAWTTIAASGNETRNNTSTLADDPVLKFTASGATKYQIRAKVFFQTANGTMDLKIIPAFTGTTNAVLFYRSYQVDANDPPANISATFAQGTLNVSGAGFVCCEFLITIDVNAGGDFSIQWAQNTSNSGDLTRLLGSYLEYMAL